MTAEMLPWILARATGLIAFALLAGTVIAGLLVRTRTPVGSLKGSGVVGLHRQLSLLALLATGAHGLALVADRTVEIEPLALVVPGLVPYRPVWTAMGVVAAEIALLVHLSFRFRRRIGVPAWRRIHFLAYAAFLGAAVHGIAAGTDSGRPAVMALYGGAVGAVAGLTAWRAVTARRARPAAARQTRGRTALSEEATA